MRARWCSIAWLLLPACAGGSAPVPLEEAASRSAAASCEAGLRCGLFPDEASCAGAVEPELGQLRLDVSAGKIIYDAEAVGACFDALASLRCDDYRTADPASCRRALTGTVADGDPCHLVDDCRSGDCDMSGCARGLACCAGICGPSSTTVADGASCADAAVRCADGSYCAGFGAAALCARRGVVGADCDARGQCADGLDCLRARVGTQGTCGPYPKSGEACSREPDDNCGDVRFYCDQVTLRCTKRLAVGVNCSHSPSGCVLYAGCEASSGKCVALARAGAPCDVAVGCLGLLPCTSGVCAASAPGELCP
jgi:hypothetical protein